MVILELMNKGLHTLVSLGEAGHYIDHNMHSERRAFDMCSIPEWL